MFTSSRTAPSLHLLPLAVTQSAGPTERLYMIECLEGARPEPVLSVSYLDGDGI